MFVDPIVPAPQLVVIGAVHIAIPLDDDGRAAGFIVSVVDPRSAFNNTERITNADASSPHGPMRRCRASISARATPRSAWPTTRNSRTRRSRPCCAPSPVTSARSAAGAPTRNAWCACTKPVHRRGHRQDSQPGGTQPRRPDPRGDRCRDPRRDRGGPPWKTRVRCRQCRKWPGEAGGSSRLSDRRDPGSLVGSGALPGRHRRGWADRADAKAPCSGERCRDPRRGAAAELHLLWLDEGDVGEDAAAIRIAAAVAGPGTTTRPPVESQARLVRLARAGAGGRRHACGGEPRRWCDGVHGARRAPGRCRTDAGRGQGTPLAIAEASFVAAEDAAAAAVRRRQRVRVRPFLPLASPRSSASNSPTTRAPASNGRSACAATYGGSVLSVRTSTTMRRRCRRRCEPPR